MSIQFVLALVVAAFCAVNAADICADQSKIETVKSADVTKGDFHFFYCSSAVKGKNIHYCDIHIHGDKVKNAVIIGNYYNTSDAMPTIKEHKFRIEMMQSPGEYDVHDIGQTDAMTYVLDVNAETMCLTYTKCFTNGKWGGSEDNGAFIGRICPSVASCDATKAMDEKITKDFLPEGVMLEATSREKCKEYGGV